MVQIQPVSINILPHVKVIFIYIRCITRRQLYCMILLYILIFSFRDSMWVQHLFLHIKQTQECTCYIHEYLTKVKSFPSLRMHDLLEILEHAFSLLDGFFQYTYAYMFYNNICICQIVVFN